MRSRLALPAFLLGLIVFATACVVAVHDGPPRAPAPPPPPPPPPAGWDVGLFYDELDPYGEWFQISPYGWVWSPQYVTATWRPYQNGRWVYSDDGWLWLSDEAWGWATYHYGRWYFDRRYGWLWVPGREWAPAWVAWRSGGGWIGWAPLPPRAVWRAGVGLDFGDPQIEVSIEPFMWCFVAERSVFEPGISVRLEAAPRNVTFIRITQNVTNYGVIGNRIVDHGPPVDRIERDVRRPVIRYAITDGDARSPGRGGVITGRQVRVFRPGVKDAPPGRSPRSIAEGDDDSDHDNGRRPDAPRGDQPSPPPPAPAPPAGPRRPPASTPGPPSTPPGQRADYPHSREVPDLLHQQEEERKRLESEQEAERSRLERLHQEQARRPPAGVSQEDLRQQQEAEHRALVDQTETQRRILEQRQDRVLKAKGRPPGATDKGKAPAPPAKPDDKKSDEKKQEGQKSGQSGDK